VDRGGRELPIAADHVALDLTGARRGGDPAAAIAAHEVVEVRLQPTDDHDAVIVRPAGTRFPADQRRTGP
jgi:pyrimidine operon attenuation protein/uracil phosphoribosyltransferase